jgi:hypothetical protein
MKTPLLSDLSGHLPRPWAMGLAAALALTGPRSARAVESVAVESDAAAYALGGYSVIVRATHDTGIDFAVGAGRYTLPTLFVKGQSTYDEAGWKATSESIQVLRVGYRFLGPRVDGPSLDLIVLNQLWSLEAEKLQAQSRFKTLGVGLSAGYWLHLGGHLYAYPTVSLTHDRVYSGEATVKGYAYRVPAVGFAGSLHLGWEF